MTNLKQYLEQTNVEVGGFDKFPQGDTFINLASTEVEEMDSMFTDDAGNKKKQYLLTINGKKIVCPKGVMADIQEQAKLGFTEVRVTRTGTTKDNTTYTVIGTKK
jgi:hypothetical protein